MKKANKKIISTTILLIILLVQVTSFATQRYYPTIEQEDSKHLIYGNNEQNLDRMSKLNGQVTYRITSEDEERFDYTISNYTEFQEQEIIKIIKSGYPYKTKEQLKCNTEFQAYIATQEAIYTIKNNRNINQYVIKDEIGQIIYNAMKQIIENAKNSEQQKELYLDFIEINKELMQDEENPDYMKKEYKIISNKPILKGTIIIETGENVRLSKTEIQGEENFKILIPKNNLSQNINIKLIVKPKEYNIKLGTHPSLSMYSGQICFEETGIEKEYKLNIKNGELTTLKITNIDKKTNTPIQGNKFQLLDQDLQITKDNLTTNEKGQITIQNLQKGTYHLKQIQAKQGYCVNKTNMLIQVTGEESIINIKITNDSQKNETIQTMEKEVNLQEENKNVEQTNNKEITNIYNKNTYKDIINNTISQNQYNNREFINTNNINTEKNDIYQNLIQEFYNQTSTIANTYNENMTKQDFINLIQLATANSNIDRLPEAGI